IVRERSVGTVITALVVINDLLRPRVLTRVNPGIHREGARRIEISAVWNADVGGSSVEAECLADFAGRERRAAYQRTIMTALNILRAAISRPPAHHVRRRRRARPAFAGAARVGD